MASNTYLSVICYIVYFSTAEASQNWVTYELEGKVTQRNGPYIAVSSLSAKADLRDPASERFKRAYPHEPSIEFAGSLTVKTSRETIVVGVNTTLQFGGVRNAPENVESNRVKREDTPQVQLVFYGQFALGTLLPESQVLRVRLNMDVRQLTQHRKPDATGDEIQFGFTGSLSASGRSTEDVFNLAMNLGIKHESFTNTDYDYDGLEAVARRYKRKSDEIPSLKIAGQFNIDAPNNIVVYGVNGEAQFEVSSVSDGLGPRDKHLKAEGGNRVLFETAGNVTGKVDDVTAFAAPLATEFDVQSEIVRKKRESSDDQVLELDYDGSFKTTAQGILVQEAGVTLRSKFWLISKTHTPSE